MRKFAAWQLKLAEALQVGVPELSPDAEAGGASFALDVDQAGFGELFDVVREGGGADDGLLTQTTALEGFGGGDLLEDGEAARVGEGAGDGLEGFGGEAGPGGAACRGRGQGALRDWNAARVAAGAIPVCAGRASCDTLCAEDIMSTPGNHEHRAEISQKQLAIPAAAEQDPTGFELLRVWVAKQSQQVTLRPGIWQEPSAWGIMLADLARSIVQIHVQNDQNLDPEAFLSAVLEGFDNEIETVLNEFGGDDPREHESG